MSNSSIPNFFIIGASKAGSTSLHHYLNQHDDIFMSSDKEPAYFQSETNYEKGLEWYTNTYFYGVRNERAIGESSASYLYYTHVAERISKLPKSSQRFIVTLRNPADRCYSQYWHQVRFKESQSFAKAIERELNQIKNKPDSIFEFPPTCHYIGRSLYAKHINNYFQYFAPEQFCFVFLENLILDPMQELKKITDFLQVDSFSEVNSETIFNKRNTGKGALLTNKLRKSLFLKTIAKFLLGSKSRTQLNSKIKDVFQRFEDKQSNKLTDEERIALDEIFSADIEDLRKILIDVENAPNWLRLA